MEGLDELFVGPTAIAFVTGEGRRRQGDKEVRRGQQGAGHQGRQWTVDR